jgi:hypothetical protein
MGNLRWGFEGMAQHTPVEAAKTLCVVWHEIFWRKICHIDRPVSAGSYLFSSNFKNKNPCQMPFFCQSTGISGMQNLIITVC